MVKCVVQGCPNHSDPKVGLSNQPRKRFYSFPNDQARVKVWLAALRETEKDPTHLHLICEDHFLPDHITPQGISEDAIPIMPPYLDGPMGLGGWNSPDDLSDPAEVVTEIGEGDDEEEEEEDDDGDDDEDEEDDDDSNNESQFEEETAVPQPTAAVRDSADVAEETRSTGETLAEKGSRRYVSLGLLTIRFMNLLRAAPDGVLDLNEACKKLGSRKRRVYDITNALNGIQLIKKKSANKIQWIGSMPVSYFGDGPKTKLQEELLNLKKMEECLDGLIKGCAQQLFALVDHKDNASSAYVTHEDICRIGAFQDQTVIAVKAPEETKLEIPTPKEDSIQIQLKGCRGPIHVMTCEIDRLQPAPLDYAKKGRFLTLEESRILTSPLLPDGTVPQSAVQSA